MYILCLIKTELYNSFIIVQMKHINQLVRISKTIILNIGQYILSCGTKKKKKIGVTF